MNRTVYLLYNWVLQDPAARLAIVKQALNDAVSNLLDNGGKDIQSGNLGDASFTYASKQQLTVQEWIICLQRVVDSIEDGHLIGGVGSIRVVW